jgi:hypothetical protein
MPQARGPFPLSRPKPSSTPGVTVNLADDRLLWYAKLMHPPLNIDVTSLDPAHRRALEDIVGHQLQAHQRLIIQITEVKTSGVAEVASPQRTQSVEDWSKVYEGLTEEQVEAIDQTVKTRANLTRNLP